MSDYSRPGYSRTAPFPTNFGGEDITVDTTTGGVSLLGASIPAGTVQIYVTNPSSNTNTVYIANLAAVTTSNGFPLEPGNTIALALTGSNDLPPKAIAAAGSNAIRVNYMGR